MFFISNIGYALLYHLTSDVAAFYLFDANELIKRSPIINLTDTQVDEVANLENGGAYVTLKFQYEHDQNIGRYLDPSDRCNEDHAKCMISILSAARPVCAISTDGRASGMASMCDVHYVNCLEEKNLWSILDNGNCDRAKRINVFGYYAGTWNVTNMPPYDQVKFHPNS